VGYEGPGGDDDISQLRDPMRPPEGFGEDSAVNAVAPSEDNESDTDFIRRVIRAGKNADPDDAKAMQQLLADTGYDIGKAGVDGAIGKATIKAADQFLRNEQLNPGINDERYDFYSNIQVQKDAKGNPTEGRYVDITRDNRTVRITWEASAAANARNAGIGTDEAIRRTEYGTYRALVNGAFDTSNLTEVGISGGWRPGPAGDPHAEGRALDLSYVRSNVEGRVVTDYFADPNRGAGLPQTAEPMAIRNFTNSMSRQEGVNQIIQPWRYIPRGETEFVPNRGRLDIELQHRGHGHVNIRRDAFY